MKKFIFIFVILLTQTFNSFSQIKIGFSAGAGFATDSLYATKISKLGGAALMLKYAFFDRFSIGVNVGFNALEMRPSGGTVGVPLSPEGSTNTLIINNSDYYTKTKSYTLVPLTFCFEYFFSKKGVKPYAGIDVGLYKFNYANALVGIREIRVSYFGVGVAPSLGFFVETMPNLELGLNLKYNFVFDNSDENRMKMFGDHNTQTEPNIPQQDPTDPSITIYKPQFSNVVVTGDQTGSVYTKSPMQYLTLSLTVMYKFGKSSLATEVEGDTPPTPR